MPPTQLAPRNLVVTSGPFAMNNLLEEPFGITFKVEIDARNTTRIDGFLVEYSVNNGPFNLLEMVNDIRNYFAGGPNPPAYMLFENFTFSRWSRQWMTQTVASVQFRVTPQYYSETANSAPSPITSFVAPGSTPVLTALSYSRWGDVAYPYQANFRVIPAMSCDKVQITWSFDDGPDIGTVTYPIAVKGAGQTFDAAFADWSGYWTTHNVSSLRFRVSTIYGTNAPSPASQSVVLTLPSVYPTWTSGVTAASFHVQGLYVTGTVNNEGRPLEVGTFLTHAAAVPEAHWTYSDWVRAVTGNSQTLGWPIGFFPDGPVDRYLAFKASNDVGGVMTDQWSWIASSVARLQRSVVTAPTVAGIFIGPTEDRLDGQVEVSFAMTCAGTGIEIERKKGEAGAFEAWRSIGSDIINGADTYQPGDVKTFIDPRPDRSLETYSYRARCFYKTGVATQYTGSWSAEVSINVDVNFNLRVSELTAEYQGYSTFRASGRWTYALVGEAVELVSLWMQQIGGTEWIMGWSGFPDTVTDLEAFKATTTPIDVARNTAWEYTFTDGVRPPNEGDLVEELHFDDSVGLTVSGATLENEDEFA